MHWLQDILWDDYASANDHAYIEATFDENNRDKNNLLLHPPLPPPPVRPTFTHVIWSVHDPHMIFETPEQIELAERNKEKARRAKLEAEQKAAAEKAAAAAAAADLDDENKQNGIISTLTRFNVSMDSHYEHYDSSGFGSHTRTDRVRLIHAAFTCDLNNNRYEWYRVTPEPTNTNNMGEVADDGIVYAPLYPHSWSDPWCWSPEYGARCTHRPRLPLAYLESLYTSNQRIKLKPLGGEYSRKNG